MVRTDSQDYGAEEILYITWIVLFDKINRLIREIIILFEVYPQLSNAIREFVDVLFGSLWTLFMVYPQLSLHILIDYVHSL